MLDKLEHMEHIGVAVKDMEASTQKFTALLGVAPYKEELVESENVKVVFFQTGETKIELLQATHPDSAIAKFIEKKGEGTHHLAFAVENIHKEIARLKGEGFVFVNEVPKRGADNKLVVFLNPKSSNGILIELCQEII
jgi:methylmalonyl-CoA/ethylmalonyl-CoA epimerase